MCVFFIFSNCTVLITVTDSNDNLPTFSNETFEFYIQENQPLNSYVGRVVATDDDKDILIYYFADKQGTSIVALLKLFF